MTEFTRPYEMHRVHHSIYQYSDVVEYLQMIFDERRGNNPRFSLRTWSRSLGLTNVASISRILRRQRPLGMELATKISAHLGLNPEEKKYFRFLAVLNASQLDVEYVKSISEPTGQTFEHIEPDQFRFISEWQHLAILEMLALSDFQPNPAWISQRLDGKVSALDCGDALTRLARLGLIEISRSGKVKRSRNTTVRADSTIPSAVFREFHKKSIERATDAIEGQNMDSRHLTTSTIAIKKSNFEEAKKIIIKAHEKLAALSGVSGCDEVYQLSTQFFRVTLPEKTECH